MRFRQAIFAICVMSLVFHPGDVNASDLGRWVEIKNTGLSVDIGSVKALNIDGKDIYRVWSQLKGATGQEYQGQLITKSLIYN